MIKKWEPIMSEFSYSAKLDYLNPRTIWTISLQLFYTIIAMLPVYYYLREIIELVADAKWVLIFLPIGIAIILFGMQLRLNNYYWKNEKIFKNRDILVTALKSSILVLVFFYFIFLYIFGYWLSSIEFYEGIKFQSELGKLMAETIISLVMIYVMIIMMISIQESRFEQTLANRFRRRRR